MKYFSSEGPLIKWVCNNCLQTWWKGEPYLACSVNKPITSIVCFVCGDRKKKKESQLVDDYTAINCLLKENTVKTLNFCILVAKNVAAESRYKAEKSEADLNRKSNLLAVEKMAELMAHEFTERRDLLL